MTRRRDFLKTAGALTLGFVFGVKGRAGNTTEFAPNAWVRIDKTDAVTLLIEKHEMGQGVWTSLPMILAEELDADWANVRVEQAPSIAGVYQNMATGGSTSVRSTYLSVRQTGAQAREMLVAAAAKRWGIAKSQCRTEAGFVLHPGGQTRLSYGALAAEASHLPIPNTNIVKLKDPKTFRFIGKPLPRKDVPAKVSGAARYGMDVRVEGMLYAVVARSAVPGGTVKSYHAQKALALPGVHSVFPVEPLGGVNQTLGGIAVVAENSWVAIEARKLLEIDWDPGPNGAESSESLRKLAKTQLDLPALYCTREEGDVEAAFVPGSKIVEAQYELPFEAHATMEPMACTADVRRDRMEVWCGTQFPLEIQKNLQLLSGLPLENVTVHNLWSGGSFGRRAHWDYPAEAWQISKHAGKPVKVMWTREDDIRHDYYRQLSFHNMRAAIGPQQQITAWSHRVVATASNELFETPAVLRNPAKLSEAELEGAANMPYAIPNLRVDFSRLPSGVRRAWWRSVADSFNAFAVECFVDELAFALKKDPLALRLELLREGHVADPIFTSEGTLDRARLKNVLHVAAELGQWNGPSPGAGCGRGLAAHACFGSYVAYVATVAIDAKGQVRVQHVAAAVDAGTIINPDGARSMIEGAINYGLTATLAGEITIRNGAPEQSNFSDYQVLRMSEAPRIDIKLIESSAAPGGLGEPGLPPIAPAVANAVFACGRRVSRLPVNAKSAMA
jgi:isoquinoline 1-oxidoreductase beta subunit